MTPETKPPGHRAPVSIPLRTALAHMSGVALVSALVLAGAPHVQAQTAHAWPGLKGAPDGQTINVSLGGAGHGPPQQARAHGD